MDRSSHSFGRLNSINHLSPFDVEIGKVHFTTFFSHITEISLWIAKTILHNINHQNHKTFTGGTCENGSVGFDDFVLCYGDDNGFRQRRLHQLDVKAS